MQNQEEKWLLGEKFEGMESEAFHADLVSLRSGTPLAYLIGSIPFLNTIIHLDSHPLIPRSETEFWTEKAIDSIRNYVRNCERNCVEVLDLCAGSGAIGIAVAKAIPEAQITFGEIDKEHLATIEKNIKNNLMSSSDLDITTKYKVIESDLFMPRSELGITCYGFILTNPPYIDPEIDRAEPSVKLHEPSLALYGGNRGMGCIKEIITQAPAHLSANGQLWIEHEPEQSSEIQRLSVQQNFLCTTHKDQYGVERYSVLVLQ